MKVNINEITARLDALIDERVYFLDKRTGEIFGMYKDAIKSYEEKEYYTALPLKNDIREYRIMEDFIESLTNKNHINRLKAAINGKGAFKRFKNTINYLGIDDNWYSIKGNSLEKIAIKWCEDNGLDY